MKFFHYLKKHGYLKRRLCVKGGTTAILYVLIPVLYILSYNL